MMYGTFFPIFRPKRGIGSNAVLFLSYTAHPLRILPPLRLQPSRDHGEKPCPERYSSCGPAFSPTNNINGLAGSGERNAWP
jgi:hypothetical protein